MSDNSTAVYSRDDEDFEELFNGFAEEDAKVIDDIVQESVDDDSSEYASANEFSR